MLLLVVVSAQSQITNWVNTGPLNVARYTHTATLLPNGKVLVAAGYNDNGGFLTSAELYDLATGTWTNTGSLSAAAYARTATLLTNGQVLVVGGIRGPGLASATAELYDPASGTWTNTGSLNTARDFHTATLLPNGKVLVAGGHDGTNYVSSAELYDPINRTWTVTGSLNTARDEHTATLLPNGKVLVAGGEDAFTNGSFQAVASVELYDPVSATWTNTGSLNTSRYRHTATLLPNGKVLVAGGEHNGQTMLASAELYEPVDGTWTNTCPLNIAREMHTATLLPHGTVLAAGGYTSSAELYDPVSGIWTATGPLTTSRLRHTATLLPNGKVLVAGGNGFFGYLASAELYDWGGDNDNDGDGQSNLAEYLAGTDPTNSASAFRITSVVPTNDDMLISWTAGGGRTNVVQLATHLTGSYTNISSNIILPGSGDVTANYLDVGAATNAANRYYRIRLVP